MANVDAAGGLKLVGSLRGGEPACRTVNIPAADGTAVFVGDAVKLEGTGTTDGRATVIQAAAGNAIYGVVVGLKPREAALSAVHRPASTSVDVVVCVDPDAIYEIQVDDDSYTFAATDVGLNANLLVGSGNTTSGASGMELDASSLNTTATLQLKVLNLVARAGNDLGDFAKVLVKINNHQMAAHTGTAGV